MARDELLVIDRTYELLKWFLGHLGKFPRSHCYGLGQQIEHRLYAIFHGLLRAKYAGADAKQATLTEVNLELESMRMLCRLAHELGFLPHKSQEHAAREMIEIGLDRPMQPLPRSRPDDQTRLRPSRRAIAVARVGPCCA
ncbi:MAG: four helix bundle protein [Phycisphaerae bacterium]|nr:four helix bundle protein [Phycisphaerae bacterium]